MSILQRTDWQGRALTVTWLPPPFLPPRELATRAYGICFTDTGEIVLVSDANDSWDLPGGHPDGAETLEEALAREVWEEARAVVTACAYIGCQQVDDPLAPDGLTRYFQARFWARVVLRPFVREWETTARRLVSPDRFLTTLTWGHAPMARLILEAGLALEWLHGTVSREDA